MDVEKRLDYIRRVGEEIITDTELRTLLENNRHPTAYDGFEPSGLAHLRSVSSGRSSYQTSWRRG